MSITALFSYQATKLTLHYFYINFDCSLFLVRQSNLYKLLYLLRVIIHLVLFFGVSVIIFALFIIDLFFTSFGSAFIDDETFPRVWYPVFSGLYTNQTYIFASPACFWKVVARVPADFSDFFASVYFFS